jgi:hypothetical protein
VVGAIEGGAQIHLCDCVIRSDVFSGKPESSNRSASPRRAQKTLRRLGFFRSAASAQRRSRASTRRTGLCGPVECERAVRAGATSSTPKAGWVDLDVAGDSRESSGSPSGSRRTSPQQRSANGNGAQAERRISVHMSRWERASAPVSSSMGCHCVAVSILKSDTCAFRGRGQAPAFPSPGRQISRASASTTATASKDWRAPRHRGPLGNRTRRPTRRPPRLATRG